MHRTFDVGLHNKRLALFPAPRGCAAEPEGARRLEAGAASVPAARDEPEKGRMVRLAKLRAAGLPVLYLLLVASNYVGPPRVHGSKLAVVLVAGGPTALLVLQARGERLPCLLAVVLAHLVVTACFVADARRLQRDLVAVPTLGALGAGLFALAAGGVAAGGNAAGAGCSAAAWRRGGLAAVSAGAPALLAALQGTGAVDRMTLLTLQQLFVLTALVLAGLAPRPAPG